MHLPFGLGMWWLTLGLIAPIIDAPGTEVPDPRLRRRYTDTQGATPIIVLVGRYPQVTTTFIDREPTRCGTWGSGLEVVRQAPSGRCLCRGNNVRSPRTSDTCCRSRSACVRDGTPVVASRPRRYFSTLAYLPGRRYPSARARASRSPTSPRCRLAHLVARIACGDLRALRDRAVVVAFVAPFRSVSLQRLDPCRRDIYVHPVLLSEKIDHAPSRDVYRGEPGTDSVSRRRRAGRALATSVTA
jgi:hypothetical protein